MSVAAVNPHQLDARERLQRVVALTEQMREAAGAGDWQRLDALEVRRRDLLGDEFWPPVHLSDAGFLAALVRRMVELNHELERLAAAERDQVASRLRKLRTGRRAENAYRGSGSL